MWSDQRGFEIVQIFARDEGSRVESFLVCLPFSVTFRTLTIFFMTFIIFLDSAMDSCSHGGGEWMTNFSI